MPVHGGHAQRPGQPGADQTQQRSSRSSTDSTASIGNGYRLMPAPESNGLQEQWAGLEPLRQSPMDQAAIQSGVQGLQMNPDLLVPHLRDAEPSEYHNTQAPLQGNESFMSATTSFQEADGTSFDINEADLEIGSPRAIAAKTKPKAPSANSRLGTNNDLEMRKILEANKHRTMEDVALHLRDNDLSAHSERNRQIFAMLW